MSNPLLVRRAAVLGAGVMGAQIAAHLTNAGVDTVLFDLPAKEGPADGIVLKAIANLGKLSPAPLASKALAEAITPANYESGLEQLRDCDLIIEAIAERMDWKQDLYKKIAPFVSEHALLASNTSGLGINKLSDVLPEQLRHRFCGVHFFNPPRYMHLAELIPAKGTDKAVLEGLESFLVTTLGKGVVYAKDTPNFIGNRIGVFSILSTIHHTAEFGLGFDEVDGLTGPLVGRPKSATYRTSDVVGLDTMAHVIKTMGDTLPDDPWHQYFKSPKWLEALIAKGALGQKVGAGIFRKVGKDIVVLDLENLKSLAKDGQASAEGSASPYRAADRSAAPEVIEILKIKNPAEKFAKLRESQHPQAQFLWATFRDLFHYSAYHLADIAETARDVDLAIRWGYGWSLGPFETWQAAGWKQVAQWIAEDIASGKSMSSAPLPNWVFDGRDGVHAAEGSYSPARDAKLPRSALPVYKRQRFPDPLLGEQFSPGETVFENDGVRMWHDGDDIAVVSFKTKMNTVSDHVLNGLQEVVGRAEKDFAGLVIWQQKEPFSAGADLAGALGLLQAGKVDAFEAMVANFQATSQRIKYAQVPVISAVRGLALGGGCEFQMHSAKTVASLESYIGLVEAGVGLLPAGGGLKELAVRASVAAGPGGDVFAELKKTFETVAMAKVSNSAVNAKELGLLRATDKVVFNGYEALHIAKAEARALAEGGYRAPLPARRIQVAGDVGIATFKMLLVNMLEGRFISEYDYEIATRIATVVCGGEIDRGALVDEEWLLKLERKHFVELAQQEKTQARIGHMLKTGKPLRN
ncbi:3-hydroxyacyl-CoA dehydrogenase/enoyl-CoA hydratase family protein [Xanthomonas campestris pv. raphani]|uniref:3-hydroxyacyl-CoA dehydrogenase/enoyl-CoA hydratase family protein n=1 Tax=Xanthomonas campestris TaxID=339 RepID=UPI001E45F9C3|nr:3-hydroxyacyl-CoA dehydrogenase/enoyl-CoA hydratase family protein [Xanthomonas campestris]MCC8687201.1 3-hydroxyacyl-CoA dehydrogenase/enoyl-CoA hydratase family protein [Xanthomonas campestris]MCC8690623.1 3-hydroxyacyl-CoA dehydrogenase/enoyl-CoA hydratase family protein [Xanthomonas campestris]MCW2000742.1 3-hydroxyacyl-CoA dehydrogenase [Xanthomonas campestris]MEA9680538.1 3-hydroxyacyl-CoA dehydrogenase/enoyl-CoA hydratase family protein [Xanthomonas campestris pv. raphani]MEA9700451.